MRSGKARVMQINLAGLVAIVEFAATREPLKETNLGVAQPFFAP